MKPASFEPRVDHGAKFVDQVVQRTTERRSGRFFANFSFQNDLGIPTFIFLSERA